MLIENANKGSYIESAQVFQAGQSNYLTERRIYKNMLQLHRIVKQKKDRHEYIPLHSHEYFHCIYGLSGEAMVRIADTSISVGKGMFVRIPPGTLHEIHGINSFQSFDIKFSCSEDLALLLDRIPAVSMLNLFEDNILKDIFHEAIRDDFFAEQIINSRMTELIYRILRKNKESNRIAYDILPPTITTDDKTVPSIRLQPAIQYIEAHLGDGPSVSALASFCGYNVSYFSTVFKNTYGMSPCSYVNSRRIDRAKELLLTTDSSITQIAGLLGIQLHTLSRMFKNAVGMSPLQYYNRANSDIGINVSKDSPYAIDSQFEIPKRTFIQDLDK